jgi:hypothetical protein
MGSSVTVAPCLTTTPATGVIGGSQGPTVWLSRRRTPWRSGLDTLGIAC